MEICSADCTCANRWIVPQSPTCTWCGATDRNNSNCSLIKHKHLFLELNEIDAEMKFEASGLYRLKI